MTFTSVPVALLEFAYRILCSELGLPLVFLIIFITFFKYSIPRYEEVADSFWRLCESCFDLVGVFVSL